MNHVRHLTAWYGAIGMGGVLHTINPRLFDDQLAYIANHAEDRVLLYDNAFAPIVERMKPQWTTIEHYICFDPLRARRFRRLDRAAGRRLSPGIEGDERDPCGLCYTSGTTGNPKGVLYEHRSTMLHALAEVAPDVFDLSARVGGAADRADVPCQCLGHCRGRRRWRAASWCCPPTTAPTRCATCSATEKVTHSAGVPTVWLGMIDYIERTGDDLGTLKTSPSAARPRRGR